ADLRTVGDLAEAVVLPGGPDRGDSQPPPHRGMTARIGAEIAPLRMSPQLLVGEPDRPVHLVRVGVDAKSPRRRVVVGPRRVLLRQGEVLAGVGPVPPISCVAAPWWARARTLDSSAAWRRIGSAASMKPARSARTSGPGGVLALW